MREILFPAFFLVCGNRNEIKLSFEILEWSVKLRVPMAMEQHLRLRLVRQIAVFVLVLKVISLHDM